MKLSLLKNARIASAMLALVVLAGCGGEPTPIQTPVGDSGECSETTYMGFPRFEPEMSDAFFGCRGGFALQFVKPLQSSIWVTQRLRAQDLDENKVSRENEEFQPDAFFPKGLTPDIAIYKGSGYDRGHLAPAADFKENPVGMRHSFLISNIVPQNPQSNRGVWAKLEKNVRSWALQKGELYVVTGPVYYASNRMFTPVGWLRRNDMHAETVIDEYVPREEKKYDENGNLIPPNNTDLVVKEDTYKGIAIPSHLYKVIYDPKTNEAIAFLVPNVDAKASDLPKFATTVANVEALTSIRFFPLLPFEQQAAIKTKVNPSLWMIE